MINFRYHVVSIAAVFFALAAGILLGSGPMRTAFVGELSGEVEDLTAEVVEAKQEVTQARLEGVLGTTFAEDAGALLVQGKLEGESVALIATADADPEHIEAIRVRVVEAGGTITAVLTLTDDWTSADRAAFRSSFASQISATVVDVPAGTSADDLIAHALGQALVPTAPQVADASDSTGEEEGEGAAGDPTDAPIIANDTDEVLWTLLEDGGLVTGSITGVTSAAIVVTGEGPTEAAEYARFATLVANDGLVFDGYLDAVVIAAGTAREGDVGHVVANAPESAEAVSTVTDSTNVFGVIGTVLALAEQVGGGSGQYGAGDDQTLIPGSR